MSSTRRAKKGSPFRQERYASSAAIPKALLGALVARRCTTVTDLEFRRVIYFLHELSLRGNTPLHPTCNLFPVWPWPSTSEASESPLERIARELMEASPTRIETKTEKALARLKKSLPIALAQMALDPAVTRDAAEVLAAGFRGLVSALVEYQGHFHRAMRGRFAETETYRQLSEGLDYALTQRGLVLMEGTYRTGKSYSAQAWCQCHLGEARYVQLSSGADQTTFFRDLAKSLGVGATCQRKACEVRLRVEDALCTQHLLLVIDEGEFLWAAGRPASPPERICWLLTSLINRGVPVAIVASRNFSLRLADYERRSTVWDSSQLHGRIRLRKQLPEALSQDDLGAVAAMLMPEADEPTVLLLVGHAVRSRGHVAAIETAVSRARFNASQKGRNAEYDDVYGVVTEGTATPARTPRATSAAFAHAPAPAVEYDVDRYPGKPGPVPVSPGMFAGAR